MTPDPAPVHALIRTLRARLRRTQALCGGGRVAAVLCLALVASFLLDYFLDMPRAVRAVHLVAGLGALAVFIRFAFRPLGHQPTDAELASAIEHEVPEFQDRLASALDFEARLRDPQEPESREMMAATVRDAAAVASRIDGTLLVDGRPARRALVAGAASALLLIGIEISMPDAFGLWTRRGLLLEDITWPRRTTLVVEGFPAEGPKVVTRGEDLRIVARADGWLPPDVELHIEEFEEGDEGEPRKAGFRDVRRMFAVPEQPSRFAFDFRAVSSSFRFWVTGGDDDDAAPVYEVRALVPPRVASFVAEVVPPPHTGLPPATVKDPVFEALVGSVVTMKFTTNLPVASARVALAEGAPADLAAGPDGREFSWKFELVKTTELHVELRAADGHGNRPEDDNFRVDASVDRPPTVRMIWPTGRVTMTPDAIVPVRVLVEDDHGLASADLDVRHGTTGSWTTRLWPGAPAPAPAPGAEPSAASPPLRRFHVFRPIDLRTFAGDSGIQTKPDDVLTLGVRAADAGGASADGPEVAVELVSAEELSQRLTGEMSRLRDDLLQVRRAQRKSIAALRELEAEAGPAPDASVLRRGRDTQVEIGRVSGDVARFVTGIHRVLDAEVLNRLGSVPTVDRMLPIYARHLAAPPDDSGAAFPDAIYAEVLSEKRANRLYDPEIVGILLDVMDLSDRLMTKDGPDAWDALERWTADGPHAAADLTASVAAAVRVLAVLDAIDERLQTFEDLAAIIQVARAVRQAQDDLTRRPRTRETK